jgi:hypothetical protein
MPYYFDFHHEDTIHSSNGSNHIVVVHWGRSSNDSAPQLSHDCGTFGELNRVVDDMIAELEKLRKKARKHFVALEKAGPTPLGLR